MSELKLFRLDADGHVEPGGSTVALEVELQRRIAARMEAMLGIRFLASEYPTGPCHRGRIDSLGLDESGTPALIEYKKGADSLVLSQAVSYLSWLDSARHEFEALVKEKLGSEAAESIDWRNSQMVCIAASFSHHDRVAVKRLHEQVDLVRYRDYDGGLLSLLLVESASGSPSPATARRQGRQRGAAAGAGVGSVQATPGAAPACLQDLYAELDWALTAWGEVEAAQLRHYIAYRRTVNVASVIVRPGRPAAVKAAAAIVGSVALGPLLLIARGLRSWTTP
ncbi:DUF5655 domain-containing protein [Streptomyces lavendulocolor]